MRIKEFLYFSFFLFYQKIFLCIQKIKNVFVIFKKVGKKVVFRKQSFAFLKTHPPSPAFSGEDFRNTQCFRQFRQTSEIDD